MIITKTALHGAYIIDIQPLEDPRGFFARSWCRREFEHFGITAEMAQANISHNHKRGTLRGMHFQTAPFEEAKLVRCTRGAIFDVAIDIREDSATFRKWVGVELTDWNHRMLYVPEGFAHGFITLCDDTEVFYQVSQFYAPGYEGGFRYDDPEISIEWPIEASVVSDKDLSWPPFVTLVTSVSTHN